MRRRNDPYSYRYHPKLESVTFDIANLIGATVTIIGAVQGSGWTCITGLAIAVFFSARLTVKR
jgi:hypothetical protein